MWTEYGFGRDYTTIVPNEQCCFCSDGDVVCDPESDGGESAKLTGLFYAS